MSTKAVLLQKIKEKTKKLDNTTHKFALQ